MMPAISMRLHYLKISVTGVLDCMIPSQQFDEDEGSSLVADVLILDHIISL